MKFKFRKTLWPTTADAKRRQQGRAKKKSKKKGGKDEVERGFEEAQVRRRPLLHDISINIKSLFYCDLHFIKFSSLLHLVYVL